MVRTQVQLPEEDLAALQQLAAETGVSVSELVRRAVKRELEGRGKPSRKELIERARAIIGSGRSDVSDLGKEHDRYLTEDGKGW